MTFLRNVLFRLSDVLLQRYHSADFGMIKKTLFHTVSILAVLLLMTSRIMLLSLLLLPSLILTAFLLLLYIYFELLCHTL